MVERFKRILIADPDKGILQSMSMFLKEQYAVCTASDGPQVLQKVNHQEVDLLIMDANLEGIYLFDLLRMIKDKTPQLPIIVMYVYLDETQQIEEYIRQMADACVVKPFRNDNLLKTIETLLKNGSKSPLEEKVELQEEKSVLLAPRDELRKRASPSAGKRVSM
jgi:DNA-binding response OmpR family regulator